MTAERKTLLLYITRYRDRTGDTRAAVEVHQESPEFGEAYDMIEVDVSDEEPDDVFGPIVQRAVEEAGWDYYIEDWTGEAGLGLQDETVITVTLPAGAQHRDA